MKLVLYGHPFSSYSWKAQIPLYADGIEFELKTVGTGPEIDAFVQATHPAGKFPILVDGETKVIEATAIVEYLAVHHARSSSLIPSDPAEAAATRMLDRVFDNYVMANMQRVVGAYLKNPAAPDPGQVEAGKQGIRRAYQWLEAWLRDNVPPPHVSLFTCAAAPSLFYADWVERIPPDCPRLAKLRAELLELPAVARCIDEARPYRSFFPPGAPDRD